MKKLLVLALLAILPYGAIAQTKEFDKFKDTKGVQYLLIHKDLLSMLGSVEASFNNDKAKEYMEIAKDIDDLKLFFTSEKKHKKDLRSAMTSYVKSNNLEPFFTFSDDTSKIKIFVNKGGEASLIKEFMVLVEGIKNENLALLSFTGNINLNDLEKFK